MKLFFTLEEHNAHLYGMIDETNIDGVPFVSAIEIVEGGKGDTAIIPTKDILPTPCALRKAFYTTQHWKSVVYGTLTLVIDLYYSLLRPSLTEAKEYEVYVKNDNVQSDRGYDATAQSYAIIPPAKPEEPLLVFLEDNDGYQVSVPAQYLAEWVDLPDGDYDSRVEKLGKAWLHLDEEDQVDTVYVCFKHDGILHINIDVGNDCFTTRRTTVDAANVKAFLVANGAALEIADKLKAHCAQNEMDKAEIYLRERQDNRKKRDCENCILLEEERDRGVNEATFANAITEQNKLDVERETLRLIEKMPVEQRAGAAYAIACHAQAYYLTGKCLENDDKVTLQMCDDQLSFVIGCFNWFLYQISLDNSGLIVHRKGDYVALSQKLAHLRDKTEEEVRTVHLSKEEVWVVRSCLNCFLKQKDWDEYAEKMLFMHDEFANRLAKQLNQLKSEAFAEEIGFPDDNPCDYPYEFPSEIYDLLCSDLPEGEMDQRELEYWTAKAGGEELPEPPDVFDWNPIEAQNAQIEMIRLVPKLDIVKRLLLNDLSLCNVMPLEKWKAVKTNIAKAETYPEVLRWLKESGLKTTVPWFSAMVGKLFPDKSAERAADDSRQSGTRNG